jgi:metal-dependent hydrolase (beta-lactamase superfamily II)
MKMRKLSLRLIFVLFFAIAVLIVLLVVYRGITYRIGQDVIEEEWLREKPSAITNFGSTKSLSILPLVNWHTRDGSLKGEAGVSYLIKTDNNTILFDVGFNQQAQSPSPIEHNMQQLGVSLKSIDTVFISHAHLDHSGGQQWVNKNTFSMGLKQVDLSDKKIYSPTPMTYPNNEVNIIPEATVIAPGIASLGAISRQLVMGKIEEQALVINVQGKGLVLIVGCGHQTVPKIIQRVEEVFSDNLYGIIGDLHYPVPEGRLSLFGINLQRYLASGDGPHNPMTFEIMDKELNLMKDAGISLIALGGHDTSDEVIAHFSETFGDGYQYVKVGSVIDVAE